MEEDIVKHVKEMTDEELKAKQFVANAQILNTHFDIKQDNVDFDEALYEQNLKELHDIGYNFETEYEEGEENANN